MLFECRQCRISRLGCCNLREEGIIWLDQHCTPNGVRCMKQIESCGWGRDDREGGEGRELEVGTPRQGIGFAITGTFSVGDSVLVGS